VLAYLDLLTGAGLDVAALDIGPAALVRLVCHAGAIHSSDFPRSPNVLLINFGAESSFVTVIWGRRLMLDRAVDFSERRLFTRLQQVLEMPEALVISVLYPQASNTHTNTDEQAATDQMVLEVLHPEIASLLQEINKTLVYTASKTRGKSVDMIYLAGRVARYPGLLRSLEAQLQIPVSLLDPAAVFASEKHPLSIDNHLESMTGLALTTGLALRGVPEHG
jgi:Tfp pilus assembly PilM family ATPase